MAYKYVHIIHLSSSYVSNVECMFFLVQLNLGLCWISCHFLFVWEIRHFQLMRGHHYNLLRYFVEWINFFTNYTLSFLFHIQRRREKKQKEKRNLELLTRNRVCVWWHQSQESISSNITYISFIHICHFVVWYYYILSNLFDNVIVCRLHHLKS